MSPEYISYTHYPPILRLDTTPTMRAFLSSHSRVPAIRCVCCPRNRFPYTQPTDPDRTRPARVVGFEPALRETRYVSCPRNYVPTHHQPAPALRRLRLNRSGRTADRPPSTVATAAAGRDQREKIHIMSPEPVSPPHALNPTRSPSPPKPRNAVSRYSSSCARDPRPAHEKKHGKQRACIDCAPTSPGARLLARLQQARPPPRKRDLRAKILIMSPESVSLSRPLNPTQTISRRNPTRPRRRAPRNTRPLREKKRCVSTRGRRRRG